MGTPRISRSAALPRGTARAPPPTGSRITAADLDQWSDPRCSPAIRNHVPRSRRPRALAEVAHSRRSLSSVCAKSGRRNRPPEGETTPSASTYGDPAEPVSGSAEGFSPPRSPIFTSAGLFRCPRATVSGSAVRDCYPRQTSSHSARAVLSPRDQFALRPLRRKHKKSAPSGNGLLCEVWD